nr:pentapeptide repeat-containing protein [uncultured Desulfobacter sp.]
MVKKFTDEEWEEYLKVRQTGFEGNPEHLKILLELGVRGWNAWRVKNPDIYPNLTNVDLTFRKGDLVQGGFYEKIAKDGDLIVLDSNEERPVFDLSHIDLKNAILNNADFSWVRFRKAVFRFAKLEKVQFECADLTEAYFGEANLKLSDFFKANLYKAVTNEADLRGASLAYANLDQTVVTDIKYTQKNAKGFGLKPVKGYFGANVESCMGNPLFRRDSMDMNFLEAYHRKHPKKYFLWKIMCNCGHSWILWAFWSVVLAGLFAGIFTAMGPDSFNLPHLKQYENSFWTYLYYSVVTFTTLGFGDIVPTKLSSAYAVMAEVIVGYIMLGGLISIFATKLARRS